MTALRRAGIGLVRARGGRRTYVEARNEGRDIGVVGLHSGRWLALHYVSTWDWNELGRFDTQGEAITAVLRAERGRNALVVPRGLAQPLELEGAA